MAFTNKKFRSSKDAEVFAGKYRAAISKHPFLLFGLPFLTIIVGGSFVLTRATAIRYERHDRKIRQVLPDDLEKTRRAGRKVNWEDEYQRLCADKDLEAWQQKRAPRLHGEPDGRL